VATTKTTTAKKSLATKTTKKKAATKKAKVGDKEVTMDRRRVERRDAEDAKAAESLVEETKEEAKIERRAKVNRRRQIDPTTCERDYSNDEIEFMQALDAYKRSSGRMFPTCSEILEVIRGLGYQRPGQFEVEEAQPEEISEELPEETIPAFSDEVPAIQD